VLLESAVREQTHTLMAEARRGGVEIIADLAAEWRALCDEGTHAEPFYRPEWISAYVRAFAPDKQVVLVTARVNGRLRAVLPLIEERTRFHGVPVKMLRGAANVHSDRFDLVHGAGEDSAEAVLAIWQFLKEAPGWDVIEVRDVPPGGAMEQLLAAAEIDGYPTGKWNSVLTPYISLPGPGADVKAAYAQFDKNFRSKLRKWRRKLEERGPVQVIQSDAADPAMLERFYALEASGWKGAGATAIASDPQTRQFYDEVAREAARFGYLALYEVQCDGRAVAMHYGLRHSGRYFVPKMGYDENYPECALGHVILDEALRDCIARGLTEFDFLGDEAEWKRRWTHQFRQHHWCYVFRKGLAGQALHAVKFKLLTTAREVKRKYFGKGGK